MHESNINRLVTSLEYVELQRILHNDEVGAERGQTLSLIKSANHELDGAVCVKLKHFAAIRGRHSGVKPCASKFEALRQILIYQVVLDG